MKTDSALPTIDYTTRRIRPPVDGRLCRIVGTVTMAYAIACVCCVGLQLAEHRGWFHNTSGLYLMNGQSWAGFFLMLELGMAAALGVCGLLLALGVRGVLWPLRVVASLCLIVPLARKTWTYHEWFHRANPISAGDPVFWMFVFSSLVSYFFPILLLSIAGHALRPEAKQGVR